LYRSSKGNPRINEVRMNLVTSLSCCLIVAFSSLRAQSVFQYSGNDSTLDARWKWATGQASHAGGAEEFWIGYSITRLMDENSQILSGNISSGTLERRNSLYFLISGVKFLQANDARISRFDHEPRIFKRIKDIALMFLLSKSPSDDPLVQKICMCSMELGVNLKNRPLFWLGSSGDEESVTRLKEVFLEAYSASLKRDLVETIALHQRSTNVFSFLSGLLAGKESEDVRAKAAFWLGEQNNPEGMKLLMDIAEKDRSLKVREEAVFAISRIESNESTDNLISLARSADNPKVRGKAAFWLGQKASQKVVKTLETIIADDEDTEVQRQALFALSQNTDKEGVDRLINVAKNHPNRRIRKQAIQILSQSDDPKALETLIEIVRN
jgi:hypothetical protein